MKQDPGKQRSGGAPPPCTPDEASERRDPNVGVIAAGKEGRAPAGTVHVPPVGTIAGADKAPGAGAGPDAGTDAGPNTALARPRAETTATAPNRSALRKPGVEPHAAAKPGRE